MKFIFAIFITLILTSCASYQKNDIVQDNAASMPKSESEGLVVYGNVIHFGTFSDDNRLKRLYRIKETTIIPATLGTLFGFYYKLTSSQVSSEKVLVPGFWNHIKPKARSIIIPPDIIDPKTGFKKASKNVESKVHINNFYFLGFRFDHESEMVKGLWKFQVWVDNKMIIEKVFDVR